MNEPVNGRYQRRFPNPELWPSSFGIHAEKVTQERVNELAWELTGHQVAGEAEAFLRAEQARRARRDAAPPRRMRRGDPGE